MSIDFTSDVVQALFSTKVLSDPAYQVPGTFGLPEGFGTLILEGGIVNIPGTGYLVDDILTLSGGTNTQTAQIKVTEIIDAGAIAAFIVQRAGSYTDIPSNPTSITGGTGMGFKLAASWSGLAQQGALMFIEIFRSLLAEIDNIHEAKLVGTLARKMISHMHLGSSWVSETAASAAETAALKYIAGHPIAADL